jgi:hypothetical protein
MSVSGQADTCFVETRPGSEAAVRSSVATLLGSSDRESSVLVGDRLMNGRFARDYVAEYRTRTLRSGPWAGGVALGVLWVLLRWLRRADDGLYASLGATWWDRMIIRQAEWLACLVVGCAGSLAVLAAVVARLGDDHWVAVTHGLRFVVMASLCASAISLASALVPLRSPMSALKDR